MAAKIIDGKKMAQAIREGVRKEIAAQKISPMLAIVLAGNDPASEVYVRKKIEACAEVGMRSRLIRLPADVTQAHIENEVEMLNEDDDVNGILVQLPLPPQIDEGRVTGAVDWRKDVDGLAPVNAGNLALGVSGLCPCTPRGIIELIKSVTSIAGKNAVVVGRSSIVGKPAALLLLAENATVTVCHSKTVDLAAHTKNADILVAAVGKANFIKGSMLRKGAIVIDAGTSKVGEKLVGDVEFESAKEVAGAITPVPGGVGPMTVAMLLSNALKAYRLQKGEEALKGEQRKRKGYREDTS